MSDGVRFMPEDVGDKLVFESPEALAEFVRRPHGSLTCSACDGIGRTVTEEAEIADCPECGGRGKTRA